MFGREEKHTEARKTNATFSGTSMMMTMMMIMIMILIMMMMMITMKFVIRMTTMTKAQGNGPEE